MKCGQDAKEANVCIERQNDHTDKSKELHGTMKALHGCLCLKGLQLFTQVDAACCYDCRFLVACALGWVDFHLRCGLRGLLISSAPGQAKDLIAKYGEDKAKDLMQRCEAAGHYRFDKNFPDDKSEIEYLCYLKFEHSVTDSVSEKTKLQGKMAPRMG